MKFKKIFFLIIILTFTFITTSCNKKEEPFFKEKGTEVTYDEIYNHFLERTIDILGPEEEFESYPDYVYVYNSYTKSNKKQGETIDNYEINEHNTSKKWFYK